MNILVADLGGTNCRFAWVARSTCEHSVGLTEQKIALPDIPLLDIYLTQKLYLNTKDFQNIHELLHSFWQAGTVSAAFFDARPNPTKNIDLAVLAIAGSLHNNKIFAPNMGTGGWHIDVAHFTATSKINKTLLINDFTAQALACSSPTYCLPKLIWLNLANTPSQQNPIAVVGAGTGLGMCLLVPNYGHNEGAYEIQNKLPYATLPSESGHASFAFESNEEWDFANFVQKELGVKQIIGDYILSGKGLSLLYQYFYHEKLTPQEVAKRLTPTDKICSYFAGFYGRACRNYVLATNAWGALYLAGGLALKNPMLVTHQNFISNFYNCTAYEHLLRQVPVYLCQEPDAGLYGAGVFALSELNAIK